jgi:dolichyl-phosphate-mannose--protein O-mannosyl transferase
MVRHWIDLALSNKWTVGLFDVTIYTTAVTAWIGLLDIQGIAKTMLFCIAVLMASVRCIYLIVTKYIDLHNKYAEWKRAKRGQEDIGEGGSNL